MDNPHRAVVFDLDGTLIDSAPDLQAAANAMLAEIGRAPLPLETVISFIGKGTGVLVERCLDATGGAVDGFDALAHFLDHYGREPVARTTFYPGVEELLKALETRGIPMAICTNKPEGPAREIARRLGLEIEVIVGGDTLDVRKPDPAPLHLAVERLGVSRATAIYVGDSETDYRTACAAGVSFIYFDGGYQRGEIEDFRPDYRISRMDAVLSVIG